MPATVPTETTREGLFTSTRWTMVLDAGESQTPPDQALKRCRNYAGFIGDRSFCSCDAKAQTQTMHKI